MLVRLRCWHMPERRGMCTQVSREPAQCLRYCFEDGEEPLWPARQPAPEQGSIPPCARCGAARCASSLRTASPSALEQAIDVCCCTQTL
jgi:hypothetical protein